MKTLLTTVTFACLVLTAFSVQARIDETVQEVEGRYGKAIKGIKPEGPATVAGLYQKNGFRIIVGFCQGKSYYELFQKLDPKNPNTFLEISQTEQIVLLKANCQGC